MPNLIDLMSRATNGPILTESDFYTRNLIPNIRQIVNEFDLRYNPNDPLALDNSLADRLYEAALELTTRSGVYCDDTNRVIHLDRHEIETAVRNLPAGSYFGEGRDRRLFTSRLPEDPQLPWFHVGTGIVATSMDIAAAQVAGYGSFRQANSISIPAFNQVGGLAVMGGSPLEILAAMNAVRTARKALSQVGRPGLPILNLISSATTAMGTLAASHPDFGLRPSDGWLIDFIAEMKVNFESLNRLAFVQVTGGNVGSTALPILGGYTGGPAGTALVMTAYYLLGITLFQGAYHLTGPVHFRYGCSTTRDSLWVFSAVGRATSRNLHYPAIALGYAAAGPATPMYYYEAAAVNLCCVLSGYGGVQTVHPAKAVLEDGVTPLEAVFNIELAQAAVGMGSDRASEIVLQLLAKYEDGIEMAPSGLPYQQIYDLKTWQPQDQIQQIMDQVKEELARMGITL